MSSLVNAIKVVHKGELWVERKLIAKYFDGDIPDDSERDERRRQTSIQEVLTTREQDVLSILAFGATNQETAQKLCISEKTVKSHLSSIFKKLNVSRRIEAILYAIKQGFR